MKHLNGLPQTSITDKYFREPHLHTHTHTHTHIQNIMVFRGLPGLLEFFFCDNRRRVPPNRDDQSTVGARAPVPGRCAHRRSEMRWIAFTVAAGQVSSSGIGNCVD